MGEPGMVPKVFTERLYVTVMDGERVLGTFLSKSQAAEAGKKALGSYSVYELAARLVLAAPGSDVDPRD